jgi:transcriptional regulator with XRE-family HTH domain
MKREPLDRLPTETVGQRLVYARLKEGMGQEELALLVGVTTRSLSAYENDSVVPYRYIRELAEILRVPMGWILHGEEAPEETGELKPILLDILKELQKISAQTDHGTTATKKRPTSGKKTTSRRKA